MQRKSLLLLCRARATWAKPTEYRVQGCLTCVRHDKYAITCYPQSTDPLPCGTPPNSGGEFLVCSCATCDLPLLVLSKLISFIFHLLSVICTLFRCLTCARHDKYAILCYQQSTDPLPCGTPPDSGGEFLVCSCTTCDLSLLVLSKLLAFALNFNFVEVRLRSLQ